MGDSFFTSRNQVDPQIQNSSEVFCNELIEASARRLAKLEGPLEAAKRLQRLSDICSGAYVLPIDHWKSLGASKAVASTADPKPRSLKRYIIENVAAHGYWFAAGMAFNMLLSALPWVIR